MTRAYLRINVSMEHDIAKVKAIMCKHDSRVVVLESGSPRLNNRVIRYAQLFSKDGWKKVNTELVTKHRRAKKGTQELHVIKIMLRRCR
jgi:predicted NAD-dependent protein-ADP-ribosyltransferase YbiA (DUF1768 family)